MMISMLTAALLAQSLPAPAEGQWEPIGTQPGGVSFAIDAGSLARTGEEVTVRVRVARERPGADGIKTVIMRYAIDCAAREAAAQAVDLYRADGSFASSPPVEGMSGPVGDDPGAMALYDRACRAQSPAH